MRRMFPNFLFMIFAVAAIVVAILAPGSAMYMVVAFSLLLGMAFSFGASGDGSYRLAAPHRSVIFSVGCVLTGVCLAVSIYSYDMDGFLWIAVGALVLLTLIAMTLLSVFLWMVYRFAGAQKMRPGAELRRDWVWVLIPTRSVLALILEWMLLV